jgi:hypothetical protein
MEIDPGPSEGRNVGGPAEETDSATDEAASSPTICFVCQQPISDRTEQLPRGEPAHPDCAARRRDALSRRTPSVE